MRWRTVPQARMLRISATAIGNQHWQNWGLIDYRRPYNTRHTLISHGLEAGMNPVAIAALTGHDVRTLYENYAGLVDPVLSPVLKADSPVDRSDTSP